MSDPVGGFLQETGREPFGLVLVEYGPSTGICLTNSTGRCMALSKSSPLAMVGLLGVGTNSANTSKPCYQVRQDPSARNQSSEHEREQILIVHLKLR
jgi:hypothetical protein